MQLRELANKAIIETVNVINKVTTDPDNSRAMLPPQEELRDAATHFNSERFSEFDRFGDSPPTSNSSFIESKEFIAAMGGGAIVTIFFIALLVRYCIGKFRPSAEDSEIKMPLRVKENEQGGTVVSDSDGSFVTGTDTSELDRETYDNRRVNLLVKTESQSQLGNNA